MAQKTATITACGRSWLKGLRADMQFTFELPHLVRIGGPWTFVITDKGMEYVGDITSWEVRYHTVARASCRSWKC